MGRIWIDGTPVDRYTQSAVVERVRLGVENRSARALAVVSVNLDHLHHFRPHRVELDLDLPDVEWLMLADGAPIARRGAWLTRSAWPRVTGADLLPDILAMAEEQSITVGFLGGLPEMHAQLEPNLADAYPGLPVVGYWAPDRATVESAELSAILADEIRSAGPEILVVGLGKPRQEVWIAEHAAATGAAVLLAFGASADFMAGVVGRAPKVMQDKGFEWLYRLSKEPRRLARRYLIQGPPALLRVMRAKLDRSARRGQADG